MEFIELTDTQRPTEQATVVIQIVSGVHLFGKVIDGRFCQYDSAADRYCDCACACSDWHLVTHFVEITRAPTIARV